MKKAESEHKPSYGMAGFYRGSSSGTYLFGSELKHHTTMTLRVHEASVRRDYAREWYSAKRQILEIEFSELQFAELLTQTNMGDGVPCTINWRDGVGAIVHEHHEGARTAFDADFQKTCSKSAAHLSSLAEMIAKTGLSAKAKKELTDELNRARMEIGNSIPFLQESYSEALDRTESEAKAHIEAFAVGVIHKLGMQSLADAGGFQVPQIASMRRDDDLPVIEAQEDDKP